jgi:hypothetical protein
MQPSFLLKLSGANPILVKKTSGGNPAEAGFTRMSRTVNPIQSYLI